MHEAQVQAPDPLIGRTISGTYVIREKIAEGGMGAVYVAVNDLGQRKVVKFLLGELATNPVIRERFVREARAAARLDGKPHIIKIDDIGVLPDGKQFMTMEFLHGRTLERHIRQSGRLPPHHCLRIIAQIVRGLYELHQAGIIHRDLKPGNVFLTSTEDDPIHVVLIDLGIAHDSMAYEPQGFRTQTNAAMGTPGYMPPEQMTNAGEVTAAADLYAVGVILWEMVTGALPWSFESSHSYYFKQRTEPPTFPADVQIPAAWLDVLRATLSPDVAARPRSLYAFLSTLGRALEPDPQRRLESGVEIIARYAKPVLQNAPIDGETVRAPNAERVGALMWTPERLTQLPPSSAPSSPPLPPAQRTPAMAATVNQRPAAPAAVPPPAAPTTLSASAGVSVAQPAAAPPRLWRVAVGLAVALVGAGVAVTVLVAHHRSGPEDASRSASAPTESTSLGSGSALPTMAPISPAPSGASASTTRASAASTAVVANPPASPPATSGVPAPRDAADTPRESPSKLTASTPSSASHTRTAGASKSATHVKRARESAGKTNARAPGSGAPLPPTDKFDPDAVME